MYVKKMLGTRITGVFFRKICVNAKLVAAPQKCINQFGAITNINKIVGCHVK